MELLEAKKVPIQRISINFNNEESLQIMDALCKYTNQYSLPNIFFGYLHIGGYNDLK